MGDSTCRDWHRALKQDTDVPSGTMQIARIFTDFGAPTNGQRVFVTYSALQEETHASESKVIRAIKDLVARGYLTPAADNKRGGRAYYELTVPGVIHIPRNEGSPDIHIPRNEGTTSPATREDIPRHEGTNVMNSNERQSAPRPERQRAEFNGLTDEEIAWITREVQRKGARNVGAVIRSMPGAEAADLARDARRACYRKPEWCGTCDERTRLVDLPDGTAGRCPECHPASHRHLVAV